MTFKCRCECKWPCDHVKVDKYGNLRLKQDDSCGTPVRDSWLFCPICGAKRPECHEKESKLLPWEILKKAYDSTYGSPEDIFKAESKAAVEHFCEIVDEMTPKSTPFTGWIEPKLLKARFRQEAP